MNPFPVVAGAQVVAVEVDPGDELAAAVDLGLLEDAPQVLLHPVRRYTESAGGDLCSAPHALYIEAGRLHVLMDDGMEAEGGPGAVMVIEPGHDAWTVGDEPRVFIDFGESVQLAERT